MARLSGKQLQKGIVEVAHRHGWLVAHFHTVQVKPGVWVTPVAADGKGFPDLMLVRERLIAVEVKGDGDKLKPEQALWLARFRGAGIETHVWTKKEWNDGTVDRVLG